MKIGGLKLSEELVQYNLYRNLPTDLALLPFFRSFAENRINLTFLSLRNSKTASVSSFCISLTDFAQVEELVKSKVSAECRLKVIAPVGTITVFPHNHSFTMLGRVISIFGKARIPIHALCTSLSSLAINTDYQHLEQAVEELEKILDLPLNHAPFRSELDQKVICQ
ncbi:MAG: hypothetical protein P4L42_11280 [Desulfocapsaceae bacterium]|nr:hypothetical protein [Desulfocapsaceae bacterium]